MFGALSMYISAVVLDPGAILYFFFSACCALTKKIETKKLHHLIAQLSSRYTLYSIHTYTEMPPLDFQDLVLLSFIAWNHCVIVLFIYFESNSKVNVDKFLPHIMTVSSWHLICGTGLNSHFGKNNGQCNGFLPKPWLKPGQSKKKSSCTVFESFFFSWQVRKRIQKTVQLKKIFGPSYFVTALVRKQMC